MKKVALFDVDEVLLEMWRPMIVAFNKYFKTHYTFKTFPIVVRDFDKNRDKYKDFAFYFMQSDLFGKLQARRGMKELIHQMQKQNYDLVVVTASSPLPTFAEKRRQNLETEFGPVFRKIHCVGSTDKTSVIRHYADQYDLSLFIDDHPYTVAQSVGVVTAPIWQDNIVRRPYLNKITKPMYIARHPTDILTIATHLEKQR